MNNINIFILILTISATVFGIFGQYIANTLSDTSAPINILTILTILSVVFYVAAFVLSLKSNLAKAYSLVIAVVAVFVSAWSMFVVLMWWG